MLYAELHRASAAVAAVFCPFSRVAAIVTREMDDKFLFVCMFVTNALEHK